MAENADPAEERRLGAYDALNSNKKSIALDIKIPAGRKILHRLAEKSDVLVEGFRPGVMKRLQADYETLRQLNAGLVYCSVTGYGQHSSLEGLVGHDLNYVSIAGILGLTGNKDSPPVLPGSQIGDWGGASQAVIGVLLALAARTKNGRGQHVDISLTDSAVSWLMFLAAEYFATGYVPKRGENVTTGAAPFNNVYETRDAKYVSIACWEPKFYENLCRALGKQEYIPCQNADGEKRDEITTAFRGIFRSKTRDEWIELLKDQEICIAPVCDFAEALSSDYARERGYVLSKRHPEWGEIEQVGMQIKLSESPGTWETFPPSYGQDTRRILEDIGYKPSEVELYHRDHIVSSGVDSRNER